MFENVPFSVEPRPFTAAMIANEMPAAMRPYSIAVAPAWSAQNVLRRFRKVRLLSAYERPQVFPHTGRARP